VPHTALPIYYVGYASPREETKGIGCPVEPSDDALVRARYLSSPSTLTTIGHATKANFLPFTGSVAERSRGGFMKTSVAGLFVGQDLEANPLLLLTVAGLRLLRLEVDLIDILPMLPPTRILVGAEPADLIVADPILGRAVGHELVAASF
jgi:hypothetical protein